MNNTDKLFVQIPHTLKVHSGTWEGEVKTFMLFIESKKCYFAECEYDSFDTFQYEFFRKKDGRILFLERGETLTEMLSKMQHTLASYDIRDNHDEFILNGNDITFYKGYDRKPMTKEEAEKHLETKADC